MTQRIAFLCSGGGGNLRFVAQAVALGALPGATISAVLTDRECLANCFAREHGLSTRVLDFAGDGQQAVIAAIDDVRPDIVITNVHRILAAPVIEAYRGRLLNLHYSLLPAYGGVIGTKPVELALADGVKFIGVTAHDVDLAVDAGRPIVQAAIPTAAGDTVASVMDTVFRSGCLALLEALRTVSRSPGTHGSGATSVRVHDRGVHFSPALSFATEMFDEAFWRRLADYPGSPDPKAALS